MIQRAKDYINGVLSGEIVTGKWIKLAMQRHVDDLKRQRTESFPYFFDEDEAARVLQLYKLFRFSKGPVAGQPFDLLPWFAALVYLAYGWRKLPAGRRFTKVYCKVARGNAKTANLVTIGTIGFLFEGVSDPEIYWIAMNQDQAKIGWNRHREMLRMMADEFPEIDAEINIPKGRTSSQISKKRGLSWIAYYGQETKGRDGLSPYYALCDEYHEWEHNLVMDRVESGMIKVTDPMTWIITTAGYNPEGPNSRFLKACKNILMGIVDSPETLPFIYELDEGDDWQDRSLWIKPNPSLGTSALSIEGLEREYKKIAIQDGKERDFKVKNLNIEMSSQAGWIPDDIWMKGADAVDNEALRGRECWGGLDLANTNDFNAFVLFFPPLYEGDKAYIIPMFWTPEESIGKFHQKRPFVRRWVEEGYLKASAGNVTDYDQIHDNIAEAAQPFNVVGIGYDTALSSYLTPRLMASGFRMEPYPQSPLWLTPPAKQVELLCNYKKKEGEAVLWENALKHGGNPVMRWMMANVTIKITDAGNSIPTRGKSADKIDGVAAMLDAIGLWLKDRGAPQAQSYLLTEDVIIV